VLGQAEASRHLRWLRVTGSAVPLGQQMAKEFVQGSSGPQMWGFPRGSGYKWGCVLGVLGVLCP
jgi:hypothetical protein